MKPNLCKRCVKVSPEDRNGDVCDAFGYRPFQDRPELCSTHPKHGERMIFVIRNPEWEFEFEGYANLVAEDRVVLNHAKLNNTASNLSPGSVVIEPPGPMLLPTNRCQHPRDDRKAILGPHTAATAIVCLACGKTELPEDDTE